MNAFIDAVMDRARKAADSAEVFFSTVEHTGCSWIADKLKIAEAKETRGAALRLVVNGQVGFFATSRLDDPDRIVATASELVALGTQFAGEFPHTYQPAGCDAFHEPTAEMGVDALIESGNRALARLKSAKPEAIFEAKLEREIVSVQIVNSRGASASYRKTVFSGFLYGSVTREGDVLNVYDFGSHGSFDNQPDEWAEVMIQRFRDAERIVDLPSGEYTCIVLPKAAGFFGPVKIAMNARSVLKDMSPFKDRVGEQIFDSRVGMVDDGTLANMPASRPVDDEGVTSRKTVLVENGVLRGFIHDLHTARMMGAEPTGNGTRSGLSSAPKAGYSTVVFAPGSRSLDELIREMKDGVVIDQVMGAHQASPFSGEFSVSVDLGFVVRDGQIIGRFKDGMLSGNAFRMLRDQLVEIGSETKLTSFLMPPLMFEKISVATGQGK